MQEATEVMIQAVTASQRFTGLGFIISIDERIRWKPPVIDPSTAVESDPDMVRRLQSCIRGKTDVEESYCSSLIDTAVKEIRERGSGFDVGSGKCTEMETNVEHEESCSLEKVTN
jgi:hypothetical protein